MLESSFTARSSKKSFVATAVASFVGIMAAIPVSLALFSTDGQAGALEQPVVTTAQVADASFAQYTHAYTQGYLANALTGESKATVGTVCYDDTSAVEVGADGAVAAYSSKKAVGGFGSAPARPVGGSGGGLNEDSVRKSYNSYWSYVYNSAVTEINNTNSNNTVGSNNSTSTSIRVDDLEDGIISVDNKNTTINTSIDDSFNKDSYNTETNTVVNNDSFNETTTVIKDSGNETTVIKDSGNETNTEVNTEIDTDVDVDVDNSTNVIRSEDVEIEA